MDSKFSVEFDELMRQPDMEKELLDLIDKMIESDIYAMLLGTTPEMYTLKSNGLFLEEIVCPNVGTKGDRVYVAPKAFYNKVKW